MKRRTRGLRGEQPKRELPKIPRTGLPPGVPIHPGMKTLKGRAVCDLNALERSIREAKRRRPPRQLAPLFKHLLNLARDSAKNGYCQRAGQEIAKAKRLAR